MEKAAYFQNKTRTKVIRASMWYPHHRRSVRYDVVFIVWFYSITDVCYGLLCSRNVCSIRANYDSHDVKCTTESSHANRSHHCVELGLVALRLLLRSMIPLQQIQWIDAWKEEREACGSASFYSIPKLIVLGSSQYTSNFYISSATGLPRCRSLHPRNLGEVG